MPTVNEGDDGGKEEPSVVVESVAPTSSLVKDSTHTSSLVKDSTHSQLVQGVKRKLDVDVDDDDDCIIIDEQPGSQRQSHVIVHTDNNNAKRPRSDTIVIE